VVDVRFTGVPVLSCFGRRLSGEKLTLGEEDTAAFLPLSAPVSSLTEASSRIPRTLLSVPIDAVEAFLLRFRA
jgi:hypothetical protein